jgi:hypothetical protein
MATLPKKLAITSIKCIALFTITGIKVVVVVVIVIVIVVVIIQFNSFIYVLDNSQIRPATAKH